MSLKDLTVTQRVPFLLIEKMFCTMEPNNSFLLSPVWRLNRRNLCETLSMLFQKRVPRLNGFTFVDQTTNHVGSFWDPFYTLKRRYLGFISSGCWRVQEVVTSQYLKEEIIESFGKEVCGSSDPLIPQDWKKNLLIVS